MASCPVCLAELRLDPSEVIEAQGRILASGGHIYRPDGVAPFADGPGCALVRLAGRGSLVFIGATGLVEATVAGNRRRAAPPVTCQDHDGSALFHMARYEAAERAVVAIAADGAALATFLPFGSDIEVHDETSAPVALLERRLGRLELVETGGGVLAHLGSADVEDDGWVDDQWWLERVPGARSLPLLPLAGVALILATKMLLGRPFPVRDADPDPGPGEGRLWPPL